MAVDLQKIHKRLFAHFGPQHWWPGDSAFEISVGAILTQNTAWTNVEKALDSLFSRGGNTPDRILAIPTETLANLIKSSGYYNQKAERLKTLSRFMLENKSIPTREELLALKGIGPETADSMLLYAWHVPIFVVDAYTIRLVNRTGLIDTMTLKDLSGSKRYEYVQYFITKGCNDIQIPTYEVFSEFHGLIIQNAKLHCSAKPSCLGCPLEHTCPKMI